MTTTFTPCGSVGGPAIDFISSGVRIAHAAPAIHIAGPLMEVGHAERRRSARPSQLRGALEPRGLPHARSYQTIRLTNLLDASLDADPVTDTLRPDGWYRVGEHTGFKLMPMVASRSLFSAAKPRGVPEEN